MANEITLAAALERIESRFDAMDKKLDALMMAKRKSLEWIATLSEQVGSLDAFREEMRASLEPLFCKIDQVDDSMRLLKHATSDISKRVEGLETTRRRAV